MSNRTLHTRCEATGDQLQLDYRANDSKISRSTPNRIHCQWKDWVRPHAENNL
ncbi:hypothetical protein RRSWK_00321 [Rhodopirellula sp. SWK7]|nr:hypothetical protein RRSWK_00321 [Rhodopirellula sp. SWK7]